MKNHLYRVVVLVAFGLTTLAASAWPTFIQLDGIRGETKSKDKHKDEIHIESYSFGGSQTSSGNRVQGNLIGTDAAGCTTGPFKFTVRGAVAEEVKKLCQSRARVGNVAVDLDGVKHRFENASFASCQSGDGSVPTDQFTLNFEKCAFHRGGVRVASGDVNGDSFPEFHGGIFVGAATQSNARLIGLSTGAVPIHLESLKRNPGGRSASVSLAKVGPGTLILSGSAPPLPQVVLELTNGSQWTFTGVTFSNIVSSGATVRMSLNFTKITFKDTPMTRH